MIGHGVYFARSREGTEGKANRRGAFICAESDIGRVYLNWDQETEIYIAVKKIGGINTIQIIIAMKIHEKMSFALKVQIKY